jgi:hypothetical protein
MSPTCIQAPQVLPLAEELIDLRLLARLYFSYVLDTDGKEG